jgi:hypothetical protein
MRHVYLQMISHHIVRLKDNIEKMFATNIKKLVKIMYQPTSKYYLQEHWKN